MRPFSALAIYSLKVSIRPIFRPVHTDRNIDDEVLSYIGSCHYQLIDDGVSLIKDVEKTVWSRLKIQRDSLMPLVELVSMGARRVIADLRIN